MRTLMTYSALVATAVVLLPIDGFAQGHGPRGGGGHGGAREHAQVERGQADHYHDRDRIRDRMHQSAMDPAQDMSKAQERKQLREQRQIHVPGTGNGPDADIYGHELMSVQERNQYREQLRLTESDPEKKARFEAQHREQMQARAKAQGAIIDDGGEIEEAE